MCAIVTMMATVVEDVAQDAAYDAAQREEDESQPVVVANSDNDIAEVLQLFDKRGVILLQCINAYTKNGWELNVLNNSKKISASMMAYALQWHLEGAQKEHLDSFSEPSTVCIVMAYIDHNFNSEDNAAQRERLIMKLRSCPSGCAPNRRFLAYLGWWEKVKDMSWIKKV